MAARATQGVIASLSIVDAPHVLVTQIAAAVLVVPPSPAARATAIQVDVLLALESVQHTAALASWLVIEAIVWIVDPWTGKPLIPGEAGMPDTFPTLPGLTYSVIKRPRFFTGIGASASGREVRVGYAVYPLWEWDLTFDYLPDTATAAAATPSDLKELLGFFLAQNGALHGFQFRDPDDHAVTGQVIATGNSLLTNFTLVRTFGGTVGSGTEPIGTVDLSAAFHVYLNGAVQDPSSYDVVTTLPVSQVLRFHSAPGAGVVISVDMSFFYYVRFKEDTYDFEKFMDKLWSQRMITLASQRG